MRTFNDQIVTNSIMNATITSPAVPLKNIFMYSIAAIVSGTPNGSFSLQASNDPETNDTVRPIQPAPINWVTVAGSTFALTTAGETLINVTDVAYNYVRAIYIDSSGGTATSTLAVIFNGKGA